MARREYKGAATPTTITGGITNSSTSLTLTDATNWPTGSFSLVIDPGLAGEEKILATSRSGTTVTLTTRGYDNTTASSHNAGAIIYPVPTAVDFDEANAHVNATTGVHGLTGAVVGTTDTQALTNKDLSSGTNTLPTAVVTLTGTQTLTNKTLTNPVVTQTINAQTGTTYTFVLSDEGKYVTASNASAQTYSIPTDATTNFNVGDSIDIIQIGAGQVTISAATPGTTTVYSTGGTAASPKLRVQYSAATLKKIAANTWHVIGDLA
jgi:hypothetical protein